MKTSLKKVISTLLCLSLVFSMTTPANAAGIGNDTEKATYIEVVSEEAVLRKGPGKDNETIVTLSKGDCLRLDNIRPAVRNKHDNLWYHCTYGTEEAYIFADHCAVHQHTMQTVTDCDGGICIDIVFCRCGYFETKPSSGVSLTSYAMPMPADSFLNPDIVGTAVALGGIVTAGVSSALPYIPYAMVAAVGGLLFYVVFNATITGVSSVTYIKSEADVKKLREENNNEDNADKVYYPAAFETGNIPALILSGQALDLNEAKTYIYTYISTGGRFEFVGAKTYKLVEMYTCEDTDAEKLAQAFCDENPDYVYGRSNMNKDHFLKNLFKAEKDKNFEEGSIYFWHFHIHKVKDWVSVNTKKLKIHILYGTPFFASAAKAA